MGLNPDQGINGKPFVMYMTVVGDDLSNQTRPHLQRVQSIGGAQSLSVALIELIKATEDICGKSPPQSSGDPWHAPLPTQRHIVVNRCLEKLIYEGNRYFAGRDSFLYAFHNPPPCDRFCNLLDESRILDNGFQRLLATMTLCNVGHQSASDL